MPPSPCPPTPIHSAVGPGLPHFVRFRSDPSALGALQYLPPAITAVLFSHPPLSASRLRAGLARRCREGGCLEAFSHPKEACPVQKSGGRAPSAFWVCTHQRSWVRTSLLKELSYNDTCCCDCQRPEAPGGLCSARRATPTSQPLC